MLSTCFCHVERRLSRKDCFSKHLQRKLFSATVYNMLEISEQQVDRLASGVAVINAVLSELRAGEIQVSPEIAAEVAEKEKRRECLVTGQIVPPGKRYSRGLSSRGEQQVRGLINSGQYSEADFIKAGKMTPVPKKGGRKHAAPEALADLMADLARANEIAANEISRSTAQQNAQQEERKNKRKVNH
jgi:hypothetical protein